MLINSDTKYPYCELPEMPELHTITEILDKGFKLFVPCIFSTYGMKTN